MTVSPVLVHKLFWSLLIKNQGWQKYKKKLLFANGDLYFDENRAEINHRGIKTYL